MNESENTPTPLLDETIFPSTDDSDPKTITDRYTVIDRLGQGGMGRVYSAHDSHLNKTVAIKILFGTVFQNEYYKRFQIEAKAASKLSHPNVVQVLDFGLFDDNKPYLSMEYVEGQTLSKLMAARKACAPEKALSIILEICKGMAHAHSQKVLHRDLKPANVLIVDSEPEMGVLILDFGIAKISDQEGTITKTGQLIGSPRYMSPEQASGASLDERSDVYSLGCIAFELLTGRPPFLGATTMETITMHMMEPVPTLQSTTGLLFHEKVESLIARALAKKIDDRLSSMREFGELCRTLLAEEEPLIIDQTELNDSDAKENTPVDSAKVRGQNGSKSGVDIIFKTILVAGILGVLAVVALIYHHYKTATKVKQDKAESAPRAVASSYILEKTADQKSNRIENVAKNTFTTLGGNMNVYGADAISQIKSYLIERNGEQAIFFFDCTVDKQAVELLTGFPNLSKLGTVNADFTVDGLKSLAKLKKLSNVKFKFNKFKKGDLLFLGDVKGLKSIAFQQCYLDDDLMSALAKAEQLKEIQFSYVNTIEPGSFRYFKGSKKRNLKLIIDQCNKLNPESFDYLGIKYGINIEEDTGKMMYQLFKQ